MSRMADMVGMGALVAAVVCAAPAARGVSGGRVGDVLPLQRMEFG